MAAPNVFPSQGIETRLVREQTIGTTPGSPTYKRLGGFGVRLGALVEIDAFAPPGAMVPTIPLVNDDYSMGEVEGRVDFNGLAYVYSGLFGVATITDLGGVPNAYQWVWLWNGRRPNRPIAYTIHNGFPESADVATGFIFNSMTIGGGRSDGFDVSGDGFARVLAAGQPLGGIINEVQTLTETGAITSGTYTITVVEIGETTAPIAFNANAATIQAALELLAGIDPGDITVAGGPIDTAPVTLTYGGIYAGRNIAQVTVDSSLLVGGTVTPSTTTPGADNVVDVVPVPAGAVLGNIYLDTTWAGIGATQLVHCMNMEVEIGERMSRVRPINKSKSSDTQIDIGKQEHMVTMMFLRNAVADAQLARLRNGTFVFPRIEWEGDTISGANEYRLNIDCSLFYTEVGMPEDDDNASVKDFMGQLAIDPVSQNVIRITLVNTISGL